MTTRKSNKSMKRDEAIGVLQEKVQRQASKSNHISLSKPTIQASGNLSSQKQSVKMIRKIQNKLSRPEILFSKVIHTPFIETSADVIGNTIARPSSLLYGGIIGLASSVGVLIICSYYGYNYNYLIGFAGFAIGYVIGSIVDLIFFITRRD